MVGGLSVVPGDRRGGGSMAGTFVGELRRRGSGGDIGDGREG